MNDKNTTNHPPLLRLKEILKEKNWTIQQLADRMSVSRQYMSEIVSERKRISINSLQRVAKILDLPIAALFADSKELLDSVRVRCPNCDSSIDLDQCPDAYEVGYEPKCSAEQNEENELETEPITQQGNLILFKVPFEKGGERSTVTGE